MPETSTDLPGGAGPPKDDPDVAVSGGAVSESGFASSSRFSNRSRADENVGPLITRVQLDETLAQVSDVVLTVATDGSIGYVSPAVRSLLGFDQEDVLGHNLVDFLPPDDAQELLTKVARRHGHH